MDAGREYGNCLMVVENNSVGFSVLEKLQENVYPNLYFSIKSTHEYVEQVEAERVNNSVAGFTTSSKTRPLIVAKMEEFVRNKLVKVNSRRLFNEMKTFVWKNGKPEAMRGYNDDLIMACAIGCWVRDTALVENQRNLQYNRAFLDTMIYTNTQMDVRVSGQEGYRPTDLLNKRTDAKKTYEKFPWLFKG